MEILNDELKFTGNWFIDVGILGFINIMEEVYHWDLNFLIKKINKEPEKVYYGYFPFAYLYKWLLSRDYKEEQESMENLKSRDYKEEQKLMENLKKELEEKDFQNSLSLFNFVWYSYICKLFKDLWVDKKIKKKTNELGKKEIDNEEIVNLKNSLREEWEKNIIKEQKIDEAKSNYYRIPIDDGFYKNFLFFNNSSGILEQNKQFYNLIDFNFSELKSLEKIDKTVNKLLPSENEFENIYYTKLSTKELKKQIKFLFVYLISFKYGFEYYQNLGNIVFYSSDHLYLSYEINKKLKLYKDQIKESKDKTDIIFRITWEQIIDTLVEYKSSWSLENMYIISYRVLDNQSQKDVEYIGIPKLQASILLDDTIREELNKNIRYNRENKIWILKEFIKSKPLYNIILSHINLVLSKKIHYDKNSCIYSLITDAKILEFRAKNKKQSLFSNNYFNDYKSLIKEIKEDIKFTKFKVSFINLIPDNNKQMIASELFRTLKTENKNLYLNILLRYLNKFASEDIHSYLFEWIFDKIIENEISWKHYSLILIIYLL